MTFLKFLLPLSLFLIFTELFQAAQPKKKTAPKPSPAGPQQLFLNPPESAKPGVLWMWMGANVSKKGITKDLEALKEEEGKVEEAQKGEIVDQVDQQQNAATA